MCITVQQDASGDLIPWEPATRTITIPVLSAHGAAIALRAVLNELHVPQPPGTAVCFCGAPISLPFIPGQRLAKEETRIAS